MASPVLCAVCGNDLEPASVRCPFCGAEREPVPAPAADRTSRTVNLEKGLPTVEQALARLRLEIVQARAQGYRALIFIHGYGSSGVGGAIRQEVRRQLGFMRDKQQINDFLPGEEWGRGFRHSRQLARRFPFLARALKSPNPGITLVVL